jgi:hypothetical protein
MLAFLLIVFYLIVVAVGPMRSWIWYSSDVKIAQRDLAISIAGIAITAWSGCLIAFTVRRRLTAQLSRGLRFMIYACFTPLVALTGSGIGLRTFAFVAAILWGSLVVIQFRPRQAKVKLDINAKPTVEVEPGQPGAEESIQRAIYLQNYIRDRIAEFLLGWHWSATLCALAIIVLVFGSEAAVVGCSLAALLLGLTLAFQALVLPDTGESSVIL